MVATVTAATVRSARGWPHRDLSNMLPFPSPDIAAPSLRVARRGPLVIIRPRVFPSAIRPGVLVATNAVGFDAYALPGAGWVSPWFWAWAWLALGLPVPVSALWVPLPRHGAARVLRRLLSCAAGVGHV